VISAAATAASGKIAHRQQKKFAARDAVEAPATRATSPALAAGDNLVSSLQKLAKLRASGVLSEKEFAAAKGKLLAR
jgi:hypothetical protein